jgi:hypothetical protein
VDNPAIRAYAGCVYPGLHGRFTEGFNTKDLLEAKALLVELG